MPSLDLLTRADACARLPRLGGMARPNGVVIVSERFWAFAGTDGTLREGEMPTTHEKLRRIPFARGLARLAASLSPLFRGTGIARRRERVFLVAALTAPLLFALLPAGAQTPGGVLVTAALLLWLLRGPVLRLHGAEHRAIAAVEERALTRTWQGDARPTRFASRCGTNFAALVLPVAFLAERLWPLPSTTVVTPLAVALVSLALTMELWLVLQRSEARVARLLLLPGLALQRLTTREPSLDETRVAIRAAASVLRRELDATPVPTP